MQKSMQHMFPVHMSRMCTSMHEIGLTAADVIKQSANAMYN